MESYETLITRLEKTSSKLSTLKPSHERRKLFFVIKRMVNKINLIKFNPGNREYKEANEMVTEIEQMIKSLVEINNLE